MYRRLLQHAVVLLKVCKLQRTVIPYMHSEQPKYCVLRVLSFCLPVQLVSKSTLATPGFFHHQTLGIVIKKKETLEDVRISCTHGACDG